jgi:hypothetical protein
MATSWAMTDSGGILFPIWHQDILLIHIQIVQLSTLHFTCNIVIYKLIFCGHPLSIVNLTLQYVYFQCHACLYKQMPGFFFYNTQDIHISKTALNLSIGLVKLFNVKILRVIIIPQYIFYI